MIQERWPNHLPVVQTRFTRATNHLDEIIQFYRDGLGLAVIESFEGHYGYSGIVLGLPGKAYQIEFTQHISGARVSAPHHGHLLVFYMPDKEDIGRLVVKLGALGHFPVATANPYWDNGVTIKDPDGWHIVLTEAP
jgi:catechol 2,3-dioxygenase-like lactoylglutathione lyase family enzyme